LIRNCLNSSKDKAPSLFVSKPMNTCLIVSASGTGAPDPEVKDVKALESSFSQMTPFLFKSYCSNNFLATSLNLSLSLISS